MEDERVRRGGDCGCNGGRGLAVTKPDVSATVPTILSDDLHALSFSFREHKRDF